MSDNIAITAGAGTTMASDDIGGVHHQRVKISLGADGAAADAPGDGTDGMLVNLGANNDVTVTGTVTANLSATDNAVLDAIELDTTTIAGAVSGSEMQVDIVTMPNVTLGAAIPAGTNNIGDVDVLTLPSIPAGTNNIGDVDVLSIAAGANLIGGVFLGNGFVSSENIYVAAIMASAAGASKNHLSIYNADASLKVDVLEAYVTKEATAAVTGLVRGHRLFRYTTAHSGGTTPTARRLDTAMGALDADVTVRAASTIGGAEAEPLGVVGVGEEETGAGGGKMVLFDHKVYNRPITLNQNEGVAIQQDATAGTGLVSAVIVFRVR